MEIAEIVVDGFRRWLLALCWYREGSWSSLYRLHNAYALWALRDNAPPCRLPVFEALLRAEGCQIERAGVYGLCLVADFVREERGEEEPLPALPPRSATDWLEYFLRSGPKTINEVRAASWLEHFSWGTVVRAKGALDVRSNGPSRIWTLPG
jgi:hypothetical protein